jgi:hypothetical protein
LPDDAGTPCPSYPTAAVVSAIVWPAPASACQRQRQPELTLGRGLEPFMPGCLRGELGPSGGWYDLRHFAAASSYCVHHRHHLISPSLIPIHHPDLFVSRCIQLRLLPHPHRGSSSSPHKPSFPVGAMVCLPGSLYIRRLSNTRCVGRESVPDGRWRWGQREGQEG